MSPSPVEIPESIAGVLEVTDGLPAYVSITWRDIVLDTQIAPPGTEEMTFKLPVHKVRACIGHARVHVVDALTGGDAYGAVLLVARPEGNPIPGLRDLAAGVHLPGDR